MTPWASRIRNEKGVALPLALFALVMLSGLLLAFISMAGMEPTIAANLGDVTRARYIADAGIEWAFDQLVEDPDWSAKLRGPDGVAGNADDGKLVTAMTLPGLPASAGTFSVTVRNDIQANDSQITGQPLDIGTATTDDNQILIVTATGTLPNGASRQIQVVVSRVPLNLPGALNMPGLGPSLSMGSNAEITGHDTLPGTTTRGSCASRYAVTTTPANEALVEATVNPAQWANITGKSEGPPGQGQGLGQGPGMGLNTIEGDASLTSKMVTDFVNAVKGRAHVSLVSTPTSPLSYGPGVIGSTCATDWNSPTCWGTRDAPKIVYVKAQTPNPSLPWSPASVFTEDIKGAGILIVEDGSLFLKGTPGWEGIIIVTGKNIALRICCGQTHDIWGAIILNETLAADPSGNTDFTGWQHMNIYYSCQAIRNALSHRATTRVTSWREL